MGIRKFNYATTFQGIVAGLLNTYTLFELNEISILYASIWSAVYMLGTISSSTLAKIKSKNVNYQANILRVILVLSIILIHNPNLKAFLLITLGYLIATYSRRQFIDLKQEVAQVNKSLLTNHGAYNAVGYGIGSIFAGYLFSLQSYYFILIALLIILTALKLYPDTKYMTNGEKRGLSRRDIYVAVLFTISITPLNNTLGLLVFANLFDEKIAGYAVMFYTLGSILSGTVRNVIIKLPRPIGLSVLLSSLLFLASLSWENAVFMLLTRLIIGALLFASQGILEERSKNDGVLNKGIEYLWNIFSLTAFFSLILLPYLAKFWGFASLGYLSIICSVVIMMLKLVVK
jgi:hypothetical protein